MANEVKVYDDYSKFKQDSVINRLMKTPQQVSDGQKAKIRKVSEVILRQSREEMYQASPQSKRLSTPF